ncbi:hypothetical protein [Streptomyces tubercidicus]|uniref:hypothetical protein n=1 Tax=Streptomyces tubercidicus TaxID=47759 RepID=UPI0036A5CD34
MPSPSPDPCDGVSGPVLETCQGRAGGGGGGGAGTPDTPLESLDPLTSLAKSVGKAAAWMVRQLAEAIESPHQIDLAGAGFVRTYAVVFAASSILVLILWLKAVTKRAVNGAKMTTAMGEAVGLLWLAVAVTAFSPAILYVVIQAVSAVTQALASALGSHQGGLFTSMAKDLETGAGGGGPLIWLLRGLGALLLCGALWLLLVLRGLALLVGEVLGILVYSGLVERDWWGKVRRWSGAILAIVAIEPIVVIVLGMAAALQGDGQHGSVVTGLAVTGIAIGASVMLILKVPGVGDGFKVAGNLTGRVAGGAVRAMANAAGTDGAAAGVMRGISAHSDRASGSKSSSNSGRSSAAQSGPQGGMAAHSQRKPRPPRQKDSGSNSSPS